jgi:hypothetical protein
MDFAGRSQTPTRLFGLVLGESGRSVAGTGPEFPLQQRAATLGDPLDAASEEIQRRCRRSLRTPERVLSMPRATAVSPFLARTTSLVLPSNQSNSGTPIASTAQINNRLRKNSHIAPRLLGWFPLS